MGGQKGEIHRGAAESMGVYEICRYIEAMAFLVFYLNITVYSIPLPIIFRIEHPCQYQNV